MNNYYIKPFIAMNISQSDWEKLNGFDIDFEYRDNYCDPLEIAQYVNRVTKPSWA